MEPCQGQVITDKFELTFSISDDLPAGNYLLTITSITGQVNIQIVK